MTTFMITLKRLQSRPLAAAVITAGVTVADAAVQTKATAVSTVSPAVGQVSDRRSTRRREGCS